jgi:hypothetical protein
MWSAIGSFLLGACGWVIARFLFEPFKEIMDLRRKTQAELIFQGNLSTGTSEEERADASVSFRRIGVDLTAQHLATYPWMRWICSFLLRWDVHSAGEMLITLGNSLQFEGFSMASPEVARTVNCIRKALRLPMPVVCARSVGGL